MYPALPRERDQWVLSLRGQRNVLRSDRAFASCTDQEPGEARQIKDVLTIFLTNRECPFRCVMCDLWMNTLQGSVPIGAIPTQIEKVLRETPPAPYIKLYNSGSFFDPNAIPPADYSAIAQLIAKFERVIVESHTAFLGQNCLRFREQLAGKLEVAIGLETAHPHALEKLNKRMTLEQFRKAAAFLAEHQIDLRVFLLFPPPFIRPGEITEWTDRSIHFAFDCGARVVSIIPTRTRNGAMDALARDGLFHAPKLSGLEQALERGLLMNRGVIFGDTWELEEFSDCPDCFTRRKQRLVQMNLEQRILPPVTCAACEHTSIKAGLRFG